MTAPELRSLSTLHGALAWAAVASLVVSLAAAWRARRWLFPAILVAAALSTGAFATGITLHGPFQSKLRQKLFLASAPLGWLFERKEHLAFGALAMVLCAACGVVAGRLSGTESFRRAAAAGLAGALVFEVVCVVAGVLAKGRVAF